MTRLNNNCICKSVTEVSIVKELCATAAAMNLNEPSVIDFGDVGDGLCRKIHEYPELEPLNEPELLNISKALSEKLKEIKVPLLLLNM